MPFPWHTYIRDRTCNVRCPYLYAFYPVFALELPVEASRADTFLLALSIVSGFSLLDKGPLGSGRDLDFAKYFNSAMLLLNNEHSHCVHCLAATMAVYRSFLFANKLSRNKLSRIAKYAKFKPREIFPPYGIAGSPAPRYLVCWGVD